MLDVTKNTGVLVYIKGKEWLKFFYTMLIKMELIINMLMIKIKNNEINIFNT
jgi:hypothetical protein